MALCVLCRGHRVKIVYLYILSFTYLSDHETDLDTGDTHVGYINHSELIPASLTWLTSHPATDHIIYISLYVTQKGVTVQADCGMLCSECFV